MSEFLLIHGSCHGAWCWDYVIPELIRLGHSARAIDLPSHGADQTPPGEVTLDLYAQAIVDAIDQPVILVGHSMAGYPITAAADLAPEKIARLIYLCAYVPIAGKSMVQMRRMAPYQPLLDAIQVDPTRTTYSINPELAAAKFYHDVPKDRAEWAVRNLGPQPIRPQDTAIWPDRARTVPRRYIRCAQDQTIPPEFQREMSQDFAPAEVLELATSHSPFLSHPVLLAATLSALATD